MNDTAAKIVLITGAGIGIGRATAERFGRDGYHVIVTDVLDSDGLSAVA
ncbi:MAG: SDR family NAD(P)-dependent oxidoreductase, partial [Alphaproteobacteria bacterium]|nr:SDR family NAD(P)-dependent oxidoreductase [Alphaproteobacteria bacterium]